ncbi:uncharacterized protein LOC111344403 [Stylophora pistillata]|nr:uncharacterized protein LOC111344403 [Stylophora pistillata]
MGYTLIKIREVWHFQHKRGGLLAPYVDTWLQIKQESSGYPAWCQTEEQKGDYLCQYKEREGIDPDPTMIAKNPGRKATAKLMLNSFWGKFGQNCNKWKAYQITHPASLLNLIDDPLEQVQGILSPELVEVVAKREHEDPPEGRATNVFIAAFTTCQERLKLYESLEILQERVLYYDTDSVVYKWKPGETEIALGDYLGDMTNELDQRDHIVEFISAGAKNYGYVTAQGKSCIKVKGFSLNVRGMAQLTYDVMKQDILDEIRHPLEDLRKMDIVNPLHFVHYPVKKRIRTEARVKSYRLVFVKRVMDSGIFRSFPYGYKRLHAEDKEFVNLLVY